MQKKRHKLYCLFLMICLITSFICFDDFKTDSFVYRSNATTESSQLIASGYGLPNEDVCTVKMLGNTHTNLLCQLTAKKAGVVRENSETLLGKLDSSTPLQSLFKVHTFLNANVCADNTDVADIIIFIHDTDGKKRI